MKSGLNYPGPAPGGIWVRKRFTQLWDVTLGLTPATEQQRKKKRKAYMDKRTGRQSLMTDTEILYFSVIGHTFTIFLPIAKVLHSITSEIYILLSVCISDLSVKQKLESKSFLENIIHLSSPNSIPGNSK